MAASDSVVPEITELAKTFFVYSDPGNGPAYLYVSNEYSRRLRRDFGSWEQIDLFGNSLRPDVGEGAECIAELQTDYGSLRVIVHPHCKDPQITKEILK